MKGSDLQKTIHDMLFYDGWLVIRPNQGGMKTDGGRYVRFSYWSKAGHDYERAEGISDLLAFKVIDGRLVWLAIEVKGDGDELRPSQIDFLIRASGNLPDRLTKVIDMVGDMCAKGRPPHMTIPVQWDDEDVFIVVTVHDAIEALINKE